MEADENQKEEFQHTVLVVDDEEHVRIALGRALQMDYSILLAEDGMKRLTYLPARSLGNLVGYAYARPGWSWAL